ncbi:MAG: hypothetical protein MK104_03405 [Erythrobacter sp.]|nr:hypothetical protein [Erythrobacter sp.]
MGASYAREKLAGAVHALAVGTGTIQERLVDAFISMVALSESDFTGDRLDEWQSVYAKATAREPEGDEGRFKATILRLNDDDASNLARDIVNLEAMMDLDREY